MKTLFIASALATTTVWFRPIRSSSLPVRRSVRQARPQSRSVSTARQAMAAANHCLR